MSCIYLHCLLPQILSGVPGNHESGPFDLLLALLFFKLLFSLQGNDGLCLGLILDLVLACLLILVPLEHDGLVLIDEVLWGASLSVASVMSHHTFRVFLKVLYTIKVKLSTCKFGINLLDVHDLLLPPLDTIGILFDGGSTFSCL